MQLGRLGAATISVDLNFHSAGRGNRSRDESAVLTRLIELFDLYETPATWAVPQPGACEAVELILAAQTPHEIALLGDVAWVGAHAGRTRFALEAARRLAAARDAGLAIRTLVSPHGRIPREHFDLLVRYNVIVVRQSPSAGPGVSEIQPQPLRHGIWQVPPAASLPQPGPWFGKSAWTARRAVRLAMVTGGVVHVTLDAGKLPLEDRRLQAVENLLRCVARGCGCGAIRSATLGRLAEEWSQRRPAVGARSILRAA
jgi:hypothetical protein